jgi:hypothetical protein
MAQLTPPRVIFLLENAFDVCYFVALNLVRGHPYAVSRSICCIV